MVSDIFLLSLNYNLFRSFLFIHWPKKGDFFTYGYLRNFTRLRNINIYPRREAKIMPKIWMIDYNLSFEQFFIWTMIFFSRLSIGVVFEDEHHVFHHHPILVHFHSEFHYDVIMMTLPWRHFTSDGHGGEFQFLQTRLSPFSIQSHCLSPFIYSTRNPWTISGPWFPPSKSFLNSPIKNFQKNFKNFPNKNVISALQKSYFISAGLQKSGFIGCHVGNMCVLPL